MNCNKQEPKLTAFCFTDTHNCFSMLEPPYIFRKNAQAAIDYLLKTTGQVDVVLEGGDFMSDYPTWQSSGHLPYEYYLGFKKMATERYAALAKGGKVMYVTGNHDYAQGEEATDGPGKNGSTKKLMGSLTAGAVPSWARYWAKLSAMLCTAPSLPYCFRAYPAVS